MLLGGGVIQTLLGVNLDKRKGCFDNRTDAWLDPPRQPGDWVLWACGVNIICRACS